MGHTLPHALSASGSFAFSLANAISHVIGLLYKSAPIPQEPQTDGTKPKKQRNAEIRARYAVGVSVPDLAQEYDISKARVYQILRGRRK